MASIQPIIQATVILLLFLGFIATFPLLSLFVAKNAVYSETRIFRPKGIYCAQCKDVCWKMGSTSCREMGCRDQLWGIIKPDVWFNMEYSTRCWPIEEGKDEWGRPLPESNED
ncbi:hypothetical protein P280DRAFT_546606 [Massarina eburnea CBS 473.64]|uniref:Uncharacterized protein n=1 Tax=Massarina eburnea CBS 473.64 TaxID=1395130 RepID=A0A6A6SB98_9PLEO|nr:hypothetical protein P280DRAFT_546606 [Massarina eburnea CBS 473.64]